MYPTDQRFSASPPRTIVIACEAKQSRAIYATLDWFASLAMTRLLSSATSFIGKMTCHYDYHSYYRAQEESRSCPIPQPSSSQPATQPAARSTAPLPPKAPPPAPTPRHPHPPNPQTRKPTHE